jgi:hypothetical protein
MQEFIPVSEKTPPPINTEVLAFHERGQTWHQVKWSGTVWVMRWDSSFRQFFLDYTHWMLLPPPPESNT